MYSIPHHHSQFVFDERAMLIGGKKNNNRSYKTYCCFLLFLQGNSIEICSIATREFKVIFCIPINRPRH